MSRTAIHLKDPTQLQKDAQLTCPYVHAIPLTQRELSLDDARETGSFFQKRKRVDLALYGFHPIPAGGSPVTNELVNELREQLGI